MENVTITRTLMIPFQSIYDDAEFDASEILKKIPQKAAIEYIVYLLHLFNTRLRSDKDFQSKHLCIWMMKLEKKTKQRLANFIQSQKEIIYSESFIFIDRRPSLDLIQQILIHGDVSNNSDLNIESYETLFKCYLYLTKKEILFQEKIFNYNFDITIDEFANDILVMQVKNIENQRFKDFRLQFLKVYYFFLFCESDETYSTYLASFLKSLGLNSSDEYLLKLFSPYLDTMLNKESTPKIHLGNENLDFYDGLCINGKILAVSDDYKSIRKYPLFKSESNFFVFLDTRFFIDKFYTGFLFDFATKIKKNYEYIKSELGVKFSEHYLFYMTMRKAFYNYGEVQLTGEDIKTLIKEGEPDYYIRNGNDVFLFEFKDLLLSADIKYSNDAEKIKNGIKEKLEETKEGQGKGITQLINTIIKIKSGYYNDIGVDNVNVDELFFYPIIVHTDITLESHGVNYFLNSRMKELINEGLKAKVKNLVLLNFDTLVIMQDYFENSKIELKECIESYLNYVSVKDPITATFPFDEFIKYHFVRKNNETLVFPKEFSNMISSLSNKSK